MELVERQVVKSAGFRGNPTSASLPPAEGIHTDMPPWLSHEDLMMQSVCYSNQRWLSKQLFFIEK